MKRSSVLSVRTAKHKLNVKSERWNKISFGLEWQVNTKLRKMRIQNLMEVNETKWM